MSPQHLAFAFFINIVMGFALVAAKLALGHFPPMLFTALRYSLILAVLFPLLKIHKGRMRLVILAALFIGPIGFGFMFAGLNLSNASVAAMASQLSVPFSTLLSIILLGEVIHWRRWLGIALSVGGVALISFDPAVLHYGMGLVFMVLAALVGGFSTVFQRQIRNVGAFEMQAWVAAVAVPLMLAGSLVTEHDQLALVQNASLWNWMGCLYVAFGSSMIGHAGLYYLLQRYEVSLTAPLMLLSPIFTVIFGVTLMGDVLTPRMIAGGLVTLMGVLIISLRKPQIEAIPGTTG